MEEQYFRHFPLWTNLTKASIQTSLCFSTMAKVQCRPHKQEVYKKTSVSSQKSVCRIIPAESAFLDIFFFGVVAHHCFTNCHLDSGSKWLTLVLPPMTACRIIPLFPVLYWCDRSMVSPCLASFCAAFYSWCPSRMGFGISTFFGHSLYCRIGWSRIHQLPSVHPSRYCQALLQCIGDHFRIHHKVMLLLVQVL